MLWSFVDCDENVVQIQVDGDDDEQFVDMIDGVNASEAPISMAFVEMVVSMVLVHFVPFRYVENVKMEHPKTIKAHDMYSLRFTWENYLK